MLIALIVLGAGLGHMQNDARRKGRYDPVSFVVFKSVDPLSRAFNSMGGGTSAFFDGLIHARELSEENRRLKNLMRSYDHYTDTVIRLEQDLEQLREISGFQAPPGHVAVKARIIDNLPYESKVVIDKGSTSGVRSGQAVLAAGGMFGRVSTVSSNFSEVIMLTSADPDSRIGAMVTRTPPNTPSVGMLHGESANRLVLEFTDPLAPVKENDLVVTSGYSTAIPRNLPIGRVSRVEDFPDFGKRQAIVFPSVNFGFVPEVTVLE